MNDHVWKLYRSDDGFHYSQCTRCGVYKAQNGPEDGEIDLDEPLHIWWSRDNFFDHCVCAEDEEDIPACSEESMEQAIG